MYSLRHTAKVALGVVVQFNDCTVAPLLRLCFGLASPIAVIKLLNIYRVLMLLFSDVSVSC